MLERILLHRLSEMLRENQISPYYHTRNSLEWIFFFDCNPLPLRASGDGTVICKRSKNRWFDFKPALIYQLISSVKRINWNIMRLFTRISMGSLPNSITYCERREPYEFE